jgi:hypothetical protein
MTTQPKEFPKVEGRYQMTKSWSIELPEEYRRHFAEGNLALWRNGMTHWIAVWTIPDDSTPESTLTWVKNDKPESIIEEFEPARHGYLSWGFLQEEKLEQLDRWALYSYTIGKHGYVQMASYIDDRADLQKALTVWKSLQESDGTQ